MFMLGIVVMYLVNGIQHKLPFHGILVKISQKTHNSAIEQ
jgi:hypothetical protein